MLVMTGFFHNEKFIPDEPIAIPQNKKVTMTIEEKEEQRVVHFSQAEKDMIRKSLFGVVPSSIDLHEARKERLS
jgi:transcriptional antiterminator